MPLQLGKSFDRNYNVRVPFLDGYYNAGILRCSNENSQCDNSGALQEHNEKNG